MPRTRQVAEAVELVGESGPELTAIGLHKVNSQAIGQTLDFAEVLRRQRQLEAEGLAVPPAEPPPRKKLRQM